MSEPDSRDGTAGPEAEALAVSRYDVLIGLQLKADARYDLCRSAWSRVQAMLLRQVGDYLGCAPDRLSLDTAASGSCLEKTRRVRLDVELANGFAVSLPLTLVFGSRPARSAYERAGRPYSLAYSTGARQPPDLIDEIRLAWTPDFEERYRTPFGREPRADVIMLEVSDARGGSLSEIPFAYYPRDEDGKIPRPDPFALAVSAFERDGSFVVNADSRRGLDQLNSLIVDRLEEEIQGRTAERGGPETAPPDAPPSWL